jgi:inhibitor of cysteine peptidase
VPIGTRRNQKMKQSKPVIIVIAFALTALLFTLSGCTVGSEVKEYRDTAAPIVVEKGSDFAIILQSNPTTGFQWVIADTLNTDIVTLTTTEYIEPDTELLGAPGEEKWTFTGKGLGETDISLSYIRPWEEQQESPADNVVSENTTQEGEAGQGEQSTGTEEVVQSEGEQPTTMIFHVIVVKAGTTTNTPKKYSDPNAAIEVGKEVEFEISLDYDPSTSNGYQWQLTQLPDESVLELVSSDYQSKKEVWTFKAVGEGDTKIDLVQVRPWEKDTPPQDEKVFSVTVKPVTE